MTTPQNTEDSIESKMIQSDQELKELIANNVYVNQINDALSNAGHPNPSYWVSYAKLEKALNAPSDHLKFSRFLINQFWRRHLGKLQVDQITNTLTARMAISDSTQDTVWLAAFKINVVPVIIKYQSELQNQLITT